MYIRRNLLGACLFMLPLAIMAAGHALNINTADSTALVKGLNGVGPQKAMAIVRYRQKHGPFRRVEDLVLVSGIGAKTVEQNRKIISIVAPGKKKK